MQLRTMDDIMKPLSPSSVDEWKKEREKILDNLVFASDIRLLDCDIPLNPVIFDPIEFDDFVVEKVIFQSLPGFYVTGSLYRPKDTTKKYPAILNPHGHWEHGRCETTDLARIPQRCGNFAMRGIVAFIYDMVGYVDSAQLVHSYYNRKYEEWNYGHFAVQTHNSLKAVDFVASLPYVDTDRIGCTGCSGGGTQTYFLTALDSRIKVAAPINMASTRMQGGCNCENAAFLRTEYNNIDYTMTIAPRPLFMSGSDGDWTVTSETVEFPAVENVYALYGASDKYEHFYQHAPHCYNLPTRERVYKFFCKHFGIDDRFDGEVDFDFDTELLKIGDISKYVPAEGFITSDEQLFEVCRGIISDNLSRYTEEEKEYIVRRVFLLDRECRCDIPYIVKEREIRFGACPADSDTMGANYISCYNDAEDAVRVCAIISIMKNNSGMKFTASGKSAALCSIAARFVPGTDLTADNPDFDSVFIPGIELANIALK